MSAWTHPICDPCWEEIHPGRTPIRLTEPEGEFCCFCGEYTQSAIYVRHDPARTLHCGGHGD